MAHKFVASAAVLDCEVSEVRLLLERHAGVLIDQPSEVLSGDIAHYLESRHLNSAAELLGVLRASSAECDSLLERLLPGETGFFRCPTAFEAWGKKILPEIKARKSAESPASLRIWSAGCSTGEEAYSIAMSVSEYLNGSDRSWNIHIVASDIRREALEAAERGLYDHHALANIPRHLVPQYFSRVGDQFLVKPRLRNLVTFTPMNLAQATFIGRFDCIFCMDVLPHFSMSQRSALLQRLHLYLEPGGYLLLGPAEKLPAADVSFLRQAHLTCTYFQRPLATAARSGK